MDLYAPEEIRSKEALRFEFVAEQRFDRSCGYSVAASILALYWNIPIDEAVLLQNYAVDGIYTGNFGVSFARLSRIFEDYGFSVKGVQMNWEQLAAALKYYAPIIVHYVKPEKHFALAIWASKDWIITLDPALGCELQSRLQFMERWSTAALLAISPEASRDDMRLSELIRKESDRLGIFENLEKCF